MTGAFEGGVLLGRGAEPRVDIAVDGVHVRTMGLEPSLDRYTTYHAGAGYAGEVDAVQTGAFLVALRAKGETAAEMTGLVKTMLRFATPLEVPGPLIDTCGTGGDRAGTLNVSTLAALVVAAQPRHQDS